MNDVTKDLLEGADNSLMHPNKPLIGRAASGSVLAPSAPSPTQNPP
jgi:hypothetical protein